MDHPPRIVFTESRRREAGIGIVEVMIAMIIMTVGLLGFVSAISSAQVLARGTKEVNLAHLEILTEVEDFRDACADDFVAALAKYESGIHRTITTLPIGKNVQLLGTLVLDETAISPPIDLNGDDDFVDVMVPTSEALVGVLHLTIRWEGSIGVQEIHYYSVIAGDDVR